MQNNNLIWALALGMTLLPGLAAILAYRRLRLSSHASDDALRRTRALLQCALDTAHAGSWRMDLTRPAPQLELSKYAQRIYGLGANSVTWPAQQWLSHLPVNADATTNASAQEALQCLLAGNSLVYDTTYPFQRPADGRQLWLRDYGQIRRDTAGRPLELLGQVIDITAQKQQDAALYRSTSALQQALEITRSGEWSVDFLKDKESLHLSRQAQAVLGLDLHPNQHYSLQEMRNNRAAAGYPECIAEVARQYEAVHSGAADVFNTVSAWRRPDNGAIVWTQTTAQVRRDAQGRLVELVGVMRDVTQEKEYELQLVRARETVESAVRTQRDFLANMSHELRTPLNAVMGLAVLALKGTKDTTQQQYLKKIRQSAQHLLNALTDILDFSAIQSGKLAMEPTTFHLQGLLDKVLDAVRETAAQKGLALLCRMDPDLGRTLVGDPLRIAQILIHYANNAVKFTDAGDIHITASMRATTDTQVDIRFAVTDTGIGLRQEQISRLFTSFTQADSSSTRRHGGNGLGLAICKKLAEAMGGSVGVHSAYGSGSTFIFDVSLGLASPHPAAPQVQAIRMAPHVAEADPMPGQLRPLWGARLLPFSAPDNAAQVLPALRTIDGLDVDVGLLCANHKPAFYVNMVRKFVSSQAKAIATLRLALQAKDASKAERVARTLKGLSGTLGASSLQSSAGALENALSTRAASDTQRAIAHTEVVLDRLIQSLQSVPGLIARAPQAAQALSDTQRDATRRTLEQIQVLLQQSDAGVLYVWQNHAAALHAMLTNAADIETAIHHFDFDIALQLIENNAKAWATS